jgi:predicted transcriptional regulator
MANILDPMDLKQIITLHLDGLSNRKVATLLGISRNTVNSYLRLFKASGLPLPTLLELDERALSDLFSSFTTVNTNRHNDLMLYLDKMNNDSNHPGFTYQYHYQQYVEQIKDPYSYTQFLEHYHRKYPTQKGSMKIDHIAGEEMFIDFAGKKLQIIDRATGELMDVEVFVAILPCSHYTYVQACLSQKKEELILCCINALHFFGGVPKAIISDNLKSAVSRASKYEPEINRSFKDFARHYNCAINPTRPYAPTEKALVENAVHLTYQRIYYPIRQMTFFSLQELNSQIMVHLKRYNELLFKRKDSSRIELFHRMERQYLKPLPNDPYEIKDYKRAKVQKMGYVYFSPDKSYYSVPYRFIGKETLIHFTNTNVEVYYNYQRIAFHQRNNAKGSYITNPEHLSSTHKFYSDWNPEFFKRQAEKHGEYVLRCVEKILVSQDYPEIGYKRSLGVIKLHQSYTSERLNNACKRAWETEACTYNHIKNILKNNMDKFSDTEEETLTDHIPHHENIRGAAAYN